METINPARSSRAATLSLASRITQSKDKVIAGKQSIQQALGDNTPNPTFSFLVSLINNLNQFNVDGRNSVRTAIINKDKTVSIPTNPSYQQLVTGVNAISANKLEATIILDNRYPSLSTSNLEHLSSCPAPFYYKYSGIVYYSTSNYNVKIDVSKKKIFYLEPYLSTFLCYNIATKAWSELYSSSEDQAFTDWSVSRNGKIYGNNLKNKQLVSFDVNAKVFSNLISYSSTTIPENGGDTDFFLSSSSYFLKYSNYVNFFLGGTLLNKLNTDTNAITNTGLIFQEAIQTSSGFSVTIGVNVSSTYSIIVSSLDDRNSVNYTTRKGFMFNEGSNTKTTIFYDPNHTAQPWYGLLTDTPKIRIKTKSGSNYSIIGQTPIDYGNGKLSFFNADFNSRKYFDAYYPSLTYYVPLIYDYSEGYMYYITNPSTSSNNSDFCRLKLPIIETTSIYFYGSTWDVKPYLAAGVKIKLLQSITERIYKDYDSQDVVRPVGYIVDHDMLFSSAYQSIKVELTI